MSVPRPSGQRKYASEMSLVIATADAFVVRAQELEKIGRPDDPPCHLYITSTRPKLSIHPDSIQWSDSHMLGVLRIQRADRYEEFPITAGHNFGTGLAWESSWPYEEFAVRNEADEVVFGGVVANLSVFTPEGWPKDAAYMDVMYVGQAYGQAGERTAWDRLKTHGTVQKILAECPADKAVWLSLVTIFDIQLITEMMPSTGEERVSDQDDLRHVQSVWKRVHDRGFADREAVALAEAGLIRYFQPSYNDRLKYNFPARKQVPLDTARDMDLHGLVVELQSDESGMLYRSETREPTYAHFAGFVIHLDEDRALTLAMAAMSEALPSRAVPLPPDAFPQRRDAPSEGD